LGPCHTALIPGDKGVAFSGVDGRAGIGNHVGQRGAAVIFKIPDEGILVSIVGTTEELAAIVVKKAVVDAVRGGAAAVVASPANQDRVADVKRPGSTGIEVDCLTGLADIVYQC
jgi:hypothetical protein